MCVRGEGVRVYVCACCAGVFRARVRVCPSPCASGHGCGHRTPGLLTGAVNVAGEPRVGQRRLVGQARRRNLRLGGLVHVLLRGASTLIEGRRVHFKRGSFTCSITMSGIDNTPFIGHLEPLQVEHDT